LKGIDDFGDLDVDVRIILKLILYKGGDGFWDMKMLNASR
jgi:hypothetical protein